jgi:tellurite resistance protein TerC
LDSTPTWAWLAFGGLLACLLGLDLFLHRGGREASRRAAVAWSVIWIVAGLAFSAFVHLVSGPDRAIEYVAAYAIEKSLSLDNLFVFLIVFKSLSIPRESQRRGLSWGIFGALAFRAVFIFLGAAAIERWSWVVYVFGALLLIAAYRAFLGVPKEEDENRLVDFLSRHMRVSRHDRSSAFLVREAGHWRATPLLVAVFALELTDVLFAIDSVPAALAVSRDEFVVYSSNAFAILGLRSLYLVMAHTIAELRYLHYGLAGVLAFAAIKLMGEAWFHVPPLLSVGIILAVIAVAVVASLRAGQGAEKG